MFYSVTSKDMFDRSQKTSALVLIGVCGLSNWVATKKEYKSMVYCNAVRSTLTDLVNKSDKPKSFGEVFQLL